MNLKFFFIFAIFILGISALNKQRDCKCRIGTQKRILNGRIISKNSYPWLTTVHLEYDGMIDQSGMAIVLNEDTLLTSRLVAYPFPNEEDADPSYTETEEFKKWIRSIVKVIFIDEDKKHKVEIDKVIFHPNFKFTNDYNGNMTIDEDVALIKLKRKIKFGKHFSTVQPACLDTSFQDHFEGALNVAGYGQNDTKVDQEKMKSTDLDYSAELREGEVFDVTKTDELCKGKENKWLCVDGSKASTYYTLCIGDEGTAIHRTKAGKSSVVAVASITTGLSYDRPVNEACEVATITSRISHYIGFIEKHIGKNYCT